MKNQKTDLYFGGEGTVSLGERDSFFSFLHWFPLSANYSFLNKKIILCLPGDGAVTAEGSNGTVKIIERALPMSL